MVTELKPCPFCGNQEIRKLTTVFDCTIFCDKCHVAIRRDNFIKCDSIAETLKEAEPEAINAWNRRTTVETNMYDKEETFPDCTVQVLTNTATGETSVGWWKNGN